MAQPSHTRESALPEPALLTVTELTRRIRGELETRFDRVHVVGEISGLRQPASGHLYLTLKDDGAQLAAVVWRSRRRGIRFEPRDGLEVVAEGQLTVYEPRGSYQLVIDRLEPRGVGALELAFRQLRERLEREGLFDPAHRKPIPRLPARIGIVTSATGAAIEDILKVIRRRFHRVEIVLAPARVQGDRAAAEIAAGIARLHRLRPRPDVLIVGRGGGSLEDLWAFNEEVVVRAIHTAEIPIISAVGHEIDTTISDLVADLRAPTPSAAAELVVPELADLEERLAITRRRLQQRIEQHLAGARDRLVRLKEARVMRDPFDRVRRAQQRLDELQSGMSRAIAQRLALARSRVDGHARVLSLERLHRLVIEERRHLAGREDLLRHAMQRRLDTERARVRAAVGTLNALSPLAVLSRGYSITLDAQGRAVRRFDEVTPGDQVVTRLGDGSLRCRVESTEPPDERGESNHPPAEPPEEGSS